MLDSLRQFRAWIDETHSIGFELRRHFFLRFFDSEFVSTPGQWRLVAAGAFAVVLSSGIFYIPGYYHKYMALNTLDDAQPVHLAAMADVLFFITLGMFAIGLLTTMQWTSLFPSLRDYLALASFPVRAREVFVAKFAALIAFAGVFSIAWALPLSVLFPMILVGKNVESAAPHVIGVFAACLLASVFVFFLLVAVQGVLLNVLPARHFQRVSLPAQGALLVILLCALPLVFSIPNWYQSMILRPAWAMRVPPFWFLGIHQVLTGNREPLAAELARVALLSVACAAGAAVLTYLWSYRRHKVRVLQAPPVASEAAESKWVQRLADRVIPDPRELAIFSFIARTLGRSRQHRLILSAFTALALAVIFESIVSLALDGGARAFAARTVAVRQAAVSAPLALSLFVLCGFCYLFRLPVELRANWIFRMNEPGNRLRFLAAVERFLIYCAVAPVALLTLPVEMLVLGPAPGFAAAILCLLQSMILMEALLFRFEKIPFTSSYLPGQRPVVQTLILYVVAIGLYVTALSAMIAGALRWSGSAAMLVVAFGAVLWKVRKARIDHWKIGQLEFEENMEPEILTLRIERD